MSGYTAVTEADRREMLKAIGVKSVQELFERQIPAATRLRQPLDLPAGQSEQEVYGALRALAERNTAELNVAEGLLSDDASRADLLVKWLGGPDELAERQMPQAFLLEVLEWNEALDEARTAPPGSPARAALDELEQRLSAERRLALERIAQRLAPLPAPGAAALTDVRRELNAVRYLERTLSTLSKLRLEQARGTR